ncbi:hypothetical protein P4H67_04230 [Paenibacillus lautus]|uniref:hypothetical protein n=1 Tax=Paenibacillus lautus TaxID=1401 RepID=UPI002DBB42A2|nr:hypothetical protein [Paenibacillus lautus]MEC0255532.1 hypothetical protein [Paenibacillus lautus]MEC0305977.1 hypothetical protein [Paenibacillus lautus]
MKVKSYPMLAGLLAVMLLVGLHTPAYGENATKKATWIWQTNLIQDGGEEVLRFSREEGINLIYLQIDRQLPSEIYEAFIQRAHENQIAVHALGGDPRWALTEHREDMLGLADWVINYNGKVSAGARFDGIHLDIEPYVLPHWEDEKDKIISTWEQNLKVFLNQVSGNDLELGIDIPFWFDPYTLGSGTSLNEWLIGTFDHVTVMAYRNEVESEHGILDLTRDELELANRLGKQILIGVNTKEMPGESHTSFYGHGKERMNEKLEHLSSALSSYASFAGIAIHDIRNWQNMSDDESVPPDDKEPTSPSPVPDPDPEPGEGGRVPDADPVTRDPIVRGTYIWEAHEVIQNSQEILDFAKEKNLNWLYVRLDLEQPYSSYSSFVKQAAAAGIEVHAMGGHPIWALEENRPRMLRLVNYVKNYNRAVEGNERFHGIHLDIEPYVLPAWRENSQQVISEWTANLDVFVTELKKDSNLEASMDMAVWLDKYKVTGQDMSLSKWMINRMDHVSLMAFRDTAEGSNGIVGVAKEEIAFADELGKPIKISVEIKASHEGDHISFYEEGAGYMEEELAKLPDLLKDSPSFTGSVVHAYAYWKNAKP